MAYAQTDACQNKRTATGITACEQQGSVNSSMPGVQQQAVTNTNGSSATSTNSSSAATAYQKQAAAQAAQAAQATKNEINSKREYANNY